MSQKFYITYILLLILHFCIGGISELSAQESVLSQGDWFKIRVSQDGVYKISKSELSEMGINVNTIDPRLIKIYGNNGGMLPERNDENTQLFLQELAIEVIGEDDGSLDEEDYVLFYGKSPHQWKYVNVFRPFQHFYNVYDEYSYYFITIGQDEGKRIEHDLPPSEEAELVVNSFLDHQFHEVDQVNIIHSGRTYYGEVFDLTTSHNIAFEFPNRMDDKEVMMFVDVASRSSSTCNFELIANSSTVLSFPVAGINFNNPYPAYARKLLRQSSFLTSGDQVDISVNYQKANNNSTAWLNYIELLAWRKLELTAEQLMFRNPEVMNVDRVVEYQILNTTANHKFWRVDEFSQVRNMNYILEGSTALIKAESGKLHEFVAFEIDNTLSVEFVSQLENQNYTALSPEELIIISPSEFKIQAMRLAQHHQNQDGISSVIVEPSKIYNEFSSGAKDITAIRNFIKHLYDKADAQQKPKYVLLFGDASFDYKNRIDGNIDWIPSWQSPNAVDLKVSFASDDYYGLMEGDEGYNLSGDLELGVGRLVVNNLQEAQAVVDKIISYSQNSESNLGNWRSKICLVGDDQDFNAYVDDSEELASFLKENYPAVNVDKIYFDAYPQESTPGGQRYPDVKKAINEQIEKGVLLVNYIGHGGESGWAHERVLELSDINSWTNASKLPIFITATCEFTRFDNPNFKSAGEYILTNPNGGGVALLTTTRATSASGNFNLNQKVIKNIYQKSNDQNRRLGDVIRYAKNETGNTANSQKFVLIGDPALQIAIPQDSVASLKINNQNITITPDTINALTYVQIEGSIFNFSGDKQSNYQGMLFPIVYDKPSIYSTLAQDNNSFEQSFELQNNVLYKGEVSVVDGDFSFNFVVPRDIAYQYDFGKISYYAKSASNDAWGCYQNIVVGGFNEQAETDTEGPEIQIYLEDLNFVSGDQTSASPEIIATLTDDHGINTVGTGIGHDIVLTLDNRIDQSIVLNDYYQSDLDRFNSGSINYSLSDLSEGSHSLKIKAWDVYNNSNSSEVLFIVAESEDEAIYNLLNYPNPFSAFTQFQFNHGLNHQTLEVEIRIFSFDGKLVKTISKNINMSGNRSESIRWEGDAESGSVLGNGVYIYQLQIKTPDGEIFQERQKLVIQR